MSHQQRIKELEEQLRARGASFMIDDGFDEKMRESFLEHVLCIEDAEEKPLRQWLAESGCAPSPNPAEDRVSSELHSFLDHLAFLGIVVEFTDHLSDRELYCWLIAEQLDAPLALADKTIVHIDVLGGGSDEDTRLYLTYYASDDERAQWKADFPDYELPPRKERPYDRDSGAPQPYLQTTDAS